MAILFAVSVVLASCAAIEKIGEQHPIAGPSTGTNQCTVGTRGQYVRPLPLAKVDVKETRKLIRTRVALGRSTIQVVPAKGFAWDPNRHFGPFYRGSELTPITITLN